VKCGSLLARPALGEIEERPRGPRRGQQERRLHRAGDLGPSLLDAPVWIEVVRRGSGPGRDEPPDEGEQVTGREAPR